MNGEVDPDETKDFFYNLYGLISSFIVISLFWIFSMYFFDYLKYPTENLDSLLSALDEASVFSWRRTNSSA